MIRDTNKVIIFEDGSEHEVFLSLDDKEFIILNDVRLIVPSQIKQTYTESISVAPKLCITPIDEEWTSIKIRFNFPAWNKIFKNNPFVISEREDGFDITIGEPITKTPNTFSISQRKRFLTMKSNCILCKEEVWYEISSNGKNVYSVNL